MKTAKHADVALVGREYLDSMICADPNCPLPRAEHRKPVILAAQCHPRAGVLATYVLDSGELVLRCQECLREFVAIGVAPHQPDEALVMTHQVATA